MPVVVADTTKQFGRYLLNAREQNLVADATTSRGGPGESWVAVELMLAGLITCAQAVIESVAREQNLPLRHSKVRAESETDQNNTTHFEFIKLEVTLEGVDQTQAESLVAAYQQSCPIYGSLSRGAPVTVTVTAVP